LVELAEKNQKIIGITPAMPTGSSMKFMMDKFPGRAFDVGIAEQHAVTLAAGMATQGMTVFCNIYSTFLQRAYDQLIHDVALQDLPIVFCLDRAGFVGEDGATHHGVFDIAFLSCIPNMVLTAPINEIELRNLMFTAQLGLEHPIAIRYPRGRGEIIDWQQPFEEIEIGKAVCLQKGTKKAILSTGTIGTNVTKALNSILNKEDYSHYHFPFIKPLDKDVLLNALNHYEEIITIEDGTVIGGFGTLVANYYEQNGLIVKMRKLGIPDFFIEQATVNEQQQIAGIDVNSLIKLFSE
ncbi:MAG: 1-deoxy-D-xylulose-5-phosphate synthase, partial [Flavobacteriaceae bacterium]|nr:1-deoxy-D-xylulose-5-phosphate synthase [Flavobacteriaceae bacterium]